MAEAPRSTQRQDDEARAGDVPRVDTQEMPVLKKDMKKAFRINEAYTFIVAVATAGGALLGGYKMFINEAKAAGAEEAKELSKRVEKIEEAQKEVRTDMRDLYKAVMYGKKSERLEKAPVLDGGQ